MRCLRLALPDFRIRYADRLACKPRRNRLGQIAVERAIGFLDDIAEVWRQHDVVELQQWMVVRDRLLPVNV